MRNESFPTRHSQTRIMYDQIAHFYDLTHDDLTEDIPFVLGLAAQSGGPILELGCGSGRLLLPLARAEFTVVGVDNSAVMLTRARARLAAEATAVQERITLVEADMTKLAMDDQFPLAIIPYNTFMHLDSVQKTAVLTQIRERLTGNGRLFIDLINPIAITQTPDDDAPVLENSLTNPETGHTILQYAQNHLDETAQTLHITWVYDTSPSDNSPAPKTTVEAAYHYLFPHQIEILLRNTGFQLESLAGDYDNTPFGEESERLLITATTT